MKRVFPKNAFTRPLNLAILLVLCAVAGLISVLVPGSAPYAFAAALAAYLISAAARSRSSKFGDSVESKSKAARIKDMDAVSLGLAEEARQYTNDTYDRKLTSVLEDKKTICDSFIKGRIIKEEIAEKAISLVISYIGLLIYFCMGNRELAEFDPSDIINRLNSNCEKLGFVTDYRSDEIRMMIESDEKKLKALREEKKMLQRIGAKLDFIESAVNQLRQQIISNAGTARDAWDEGTEGATDADKMQALLDNAINEASALEKELESRQGSEQ